MDSKESRQYFRIRDEIGVRLQPLAEEQYQARQRIMKLTEAPKMDGFSRLEYQIQMAVDRLKITSPDIADVVELLNQKLDSIAEHTPLGERLRSLDDYPLVEVDLSATGIALCHDKKIGRDSMVSLSLVLPPNRQHLALLAKVMSSEEERVATRGSSGSGVALAAVGDAREVTVYRLGMKFVDMSESVSEFLIQYLVQRQGALIKAQREGR
ncbi:MAG: hypothetical protein DHS20C12_28620 [Pseudohongiella sp.]|nr:MAG: hypothetical protein DHS20C12_28620 [Pseudohongiella sp.]